MKKVLVLLAIFSASGLHADAITSVMISSGQKNANASENEPQKVAVALTISKTNGPTIELQVQGTLLTTDGNKAGIGTGEQTAVIDLNAIDGSSSSQIKKAVNPTSQYVVVTDQGTIFHDVATPDNPVASGVNLWGFQHRIGDYNYPGPGTTMQNQVLHKVFCQHECKFGND